MKLVPYRFEFGNANNPSAVTLAAQDVQEAVKNFRNLFPTEKLNRIVRTTDRAVLEHRSTVKVQELRVGDQYDDGHATVYTVTETLPVNRGGMVSLRVSHGPWSEWQSFEAGTLMGLLNR